MTLDDYSKLADELELAKQSHYDCEDRWYSCATITCNDGRKSDQCDCGADKLNILLDRASIALRLAAQAEQYAQEDAAEIDRLSRMLQEEIGKHDALAAQAQEWKKDAEKWHEHAKVMRMATLPGALHMRLTMNERGRAWGIESVLNADSYGRGNLGIEAVGLAAKQKTEELFAALAAEEKKT